MQSRINDNQLQNPGYGQLQQPLLGYVQQQQPWQQPQQPLPGYLQQQQPQRPILGYVQQQQPGRGSYGSIQQPLAPPGYNPSPQGYHEQGGRTPVTFMAAPVPISGCPPGLEYLTQIDQLLIHQQIDLFEVVTNYIAGDRFEIKNSLGQQVYFSSEESGECERQCCGTHRGFIMHITNNYNQEVIRVTREFKCCAGCGCCASFDCCAMNVIIEAPVGQVVGIVRQQSSCWLPAYEVLDANSHLVFTIEGPCCNCQAPCCPDDIEFMVLSKAERPVGKICKQWGGWAKETLTTAENFSVHFPMDLDVRMKAVLLGAVFLIDLIHFERKGHKNKRNLPNTSDF